MTDDLETAISEITIFPDGRVYVFGMSRQVLEVLQSFPTGDARLHLLHEQLQRRTDCQSVLRQESTVRSGGGGTEMK
jgi:hypothetical protein